MEKEIKIVLSKYNQILNLKKDLINEQDIYGIDELVYNPATKSGGLVGYGYDRGIKQPIAWGGHDNHLHIGFTNRDVAMAVIDKAAQLGLYTTENPYAKRDPNGKVDKVHTSGSFHYKTFEGEPKVGAGVDISGDTQKIVELIKWIEQQYTNAPQYSVDTQIRSHEEPTAKKTEQKPENKTNTTAKKPTVTPTVAATEIPDLPKNELLYSLASDIGKAIFPNESVKKKKIQEEINRIKSLLK